MRVPTTFKKLAIFTDLHLGRRNNSPIHNQDCLDFVNWFCAQVRSSGDCSHVCFLGDWFESRSAINIETLEFSYRALKQIDELGLPVYFVVGNHDLHRKYTRDLHSVRMFNELSNFKVIDHVHVEDELLFAPYLFDAEYPALIQHVGRWAWLGHFEFKNFIVTGHNVVLDHGPDHKMFAGPKRILSGHFHKRQGQDHVQYIGNAMPCDFGDAGDYNRGMVYYQVETNELSFVDWLAAPSYLKTRLTDVLAERWTPKPKMKVKCIIDAELGYQDAQDLRDAMIESYQLRDFVLEEDRAAIQGTLEGEHVKVTEEALNFSNIDDLVTQQLALLKSDATCKMDVDLLTKIYGELPVEITENE